MLISEWFRTSIVEKNVRSEFGKTGKEFCRSNFLLIILGVVLKKSRCTAQHFRQSNDQMTVGRMAGMYCVTIIADTNYSLDFTPKMGKLLRSEYINNQAPFLLKFLMLLLPLKT